MTELAIVVTLVLLTSGACSLFEAVLYSLPVSQIERLERAGRPSGRTLKRLRTQIDRPIAAILSLNTISNTGGAALAGALATSALGADLIPHFSVAFTLGILLFAEVLPKTIGVVYTRRLAPLIASPLQLLVTALTPLVWLTRLVTKLVATRQDEHRVSDDELLTMVTLGVRSGDFQPDEARVIRNVLALETKTVRDILTPRPVVMTLSAETTVQEAAAHPDLSRHSRIPVWDADPEDLVGIVHKVDILRSVASDRFQVKLDTLMSPIHFVTDTLPLDQLMRTLLERRQHLVAVIDEFGGLAGIVALEDVIEELIGREIVDESDQETDLRAFAHRRREELLRRRR